jgi:UDP-galactopyranose mutase
MSMSYGDLSKSQLPMNLSKLTHCYQLSIAEKSVTKTRNQVNLVKIASHLQQVSNHQILQSLGEFLNV